ncbi:MAG: stalk domain-containing protein [Bacillota bacterium]|nr:stalk domain-containing protein [Bacillota bacterium]
MNPPHYITLHLEGREYQLQNPLIVHEGVTYAPFREVFSLLGAEVGYTSKHGRLLVWADLAGHRFLLENGTSAFYYNNTLLSLPGVPPLVQGTYYFPLRFLLSLAGYEIHWQPQPKNHDQPQKAHIYLKHPDSRQNSEEEKTADSQLTLPLQQFLNQARKEFLSSCTTISCPMINMTAAVGPLSP